MLFISDRLDTPDMLDVRKRDERKKRVCCVGGVVLER